MQLQRLPARLHCNSGSPRRGFIATPAAPTILHHNIGGTTMLHCNSGGPDDVESQHRRSPEMLRCSSGGLMMLHQKPASPRLHCNVLHRPSAARSSPSACITSDYCSITFCYNPRRQPAAPRRRMVIWPLLRSSSPHHRLQRAQGEACDLPLPCNYVDCRDEGGLQHHRLLLPPASLHRRPL